MTTRRHARPAPMDRLVDLFVALYPAEFRRGYGRAIAQLIRDQRRGLGSASRAPGGPPALTASQHVRGRVS